MKIVDELVDDASRKYGHARYSEADVITADAEEWKDEISKRLVPIRAALHMMWDNPESMTPGDMLAQYTAACEMLDED